MNALSRKFSSVLAVTAIMATMALASPVAAAVHSFGKTYTVSATVKGGKNLTVLLISGSGRLLASKKLRARIRRSLLSLLPPHQLVAPRFSWSIVLALQKVHTSAQ